MVRRMGASETERRAFSPLLHPLLFSWPPPSESWRRGRGASCAHLWKRASGGAGSSRGAVNSGHSLVASSGEGARRAGALGRAPVLAGRNARAAGGSAWHAARAGAWRAWFVCGCSCGCGCGRVGECVGGWVGGRCARRVCLCVGAGPSVVRDLCVVMVVGGVWVRVRGMHAYVRARAGLVCVC